MAGRLALLFLLMFAPVCKIQSQSRMDIKNMFVEAEMWILFEDYKEALPLYQQLLKVNPTNANYKYRIGQCYINTPGEKEKAVSYLEDAVKNISPDYKEGKFRESKAPYDALYYLANAYRINNQLDKALETYEVFKRNMNTDVYDSSIVNLQIQSCLNAKELMRLPLFIREKNLSSLINESSSEFNPVVSDNEDLLVFSRSEAFYDAIMYSTRSNGGWTGPLNMNEILKVDNYLFPTSLSHDGKTLYLYSSADYDGIIYSSTLENGTWSPLAKLNDNINTKYWESHASVSHDNKRLYFTSNRKGTYGGLDIYVSQRDSTGDWGPARNLGPVINTPYNEESPFLSKDDKTLFFSSRGHFNMGGYDIFYSTILDNGEMSVPLNVGYPLNSTDDDVFFKPLNDGYEGYFAKETRGGFGKQDIYRIEIFSDDHPRKFLIRGMVKVADLLNNYEDSVRIMAMNIKNPNQTVVVYSNPKTGEYEFELPHGEYQVTFEGDGTEKITKNISLPLTNPSDSFVLPGTILPKTDFVADLNVRSNRTISVAKGDSIMFPLSVEPKSVLTIERWVGDSLISSERFVMNDTVFNYKMVPSQGDNKVVFKLADRFNNITSTEVLITREKQATEQPLVRPEYSRIIAQKQIDAFMGMLKSRADERLKKLISSIDISDKKFGTVDDVLAYLKEEGAKNGINPEEIDRLALKVAVMDNILSQSAINYMAKYSDEEIRKIFADMDIYKLRLKTWTDLQKYLENLFGEKMNPGALNMLAASILADVDPTINLIREKILAYSNSSDLGTVIRESVATVDLKNIKDRGKWLDAFHIESTKQGLSHDQLADLLATISKEPGTKTEKYLRDLAGQSDEPLLSSLNILDLKEEKIKSPAGLLKFIITNEDKVKYPDLHVFKAISSLIVKKDIPADDILSGHKQGQKGLWWILLLVAIAGIIWFLIAGRRKKDDKKKKR